MGDFNIFIAATSSVILFIFGLENFSKEVQKVTGDQFRKFIGKVTNYTSIGVLIGAFVTAVVQSSSATSVIAISLVNAGVLSFKNSVGIIFGSNVGTTITAQLVAFKLTAFGPVFIILSFFLSLIKTKYSVFAKSLFYFGFVFFALHLISSTLVPLQSDERLISFLSKPHNPFLGVLVGMIITAVVQSSSVTTGLAIILTQQGILSVGNAVPILLGANIGTTVTALISIVNMDIAAKKTALSHFLFNFGGVVLFLPIVFIWGDKFKLLADDPAIALANFHLIFNVTTTIIFIIAIDPFIRFVDKVLGEGKMDFERFDLSMFSPDNDFSEIERNLYLNIPKTYDFVQENYNLITLSIETNYKGVFNAAKRRMDYIDYVEDELISFFSNYIATCTSEKEINTIIHIMSIYEYIFQIHDSVKDLSDLKDSMDKNYIELKSDLIIIIRSLATRTLSFFETMSNPHLDEEQKRELKKEVNEFQFNIIEYNKRILKLMAAPDRRDASVIMHMITYSQRLKDKLVHYHNLISDHAVSSSDINDSLSTH
ncbi:Na/Pi cotransporter family protein [Halobacteriovorax sp. YZS-1-1]|uniref:Na/Pi cotransporter family protein n=1 Tax=unclassified Halobacteriovorax TaxID=2639665 RepID=UPI00399B5C1C